MDTLYMIIFFVFQNMTFKVKFNAKVFMERANFLFIGLREQAVQKFMDSNCLI